MNMRETDSPSSVKYRIAISIILIVVGMLFVTLTDDVKEGKVIVLQKFGLALMVAGAVSILTDAFLESRRERDRFPTDYIEKTGIQILSLIRQGDDRYHSWVVVRNPQELFFAGRSVLHRIQLDFDDRRLPSVEEILIRKLSEGTRIRILFCNPLWDAIPSIATAEGQTSEKLYNDLQTSIEIVKKLHGKLKESSQKLSGEIDIRLYQEQFQYAYHRTLNLQTDEMKMYLGMYFAKRQGCRSPLFEVYDRSIQKEFEDHFHNVFERSDRFFFYPRSGVGMMFDERLYHKIQRQISNTKYHGEFQ